ncbi:hypothetical protein KAX17_18100 [Candidatus Bipolaricaulota bacterium]|nr:hypothetical protein [Candidatus Bipolaricaulota bacterium]
MTNGETEAGKDAHIRSHTVAQWESIFDDLYGAVNRGRPIEQIWVAVMAQCSELGEGLRKGNLQEILVEAADVFEWLCTFVTALRRPGSVFTAQMNLSTAVSLKYPGVCGRCFGLASAPSAENLPVPVPGEYTHCVCLPRKMESAYDKPVEYGLAFEYNQRAAKVLDFDSFTILDWQRVFHGTFGRNTHFSTIEMIGYHFLEEAGEVALAVRHLSQLKKAINMKSIGPTVREWGHAVKSLFTYCEENKSRLSDKDQLRYDLHREKNLLLRLAFGKVHVLLELGDMYAWLCSLLSKMEDSIEQNAAFFKYVADLYGFHESKRNCNRVSHQDTERRIRKMLSETPLLEMQLQRTYFPDDGEAASCPTCHKKTCDCLFLQTDEDVEKFAKRHTNEILRA